MKSIPMNQFDNNMQKIILLFGMIEIIIGFSGVILADFFSIFNLLTILSGAAGLIALFFCILQPAKIKSYDLLAMAMVLAYGTGTLNSLVMYALDGMDLLKRSNVEEYWLTRTLGLATAAAGFLHVLGRADNNSYLFNDFSINESDKKRLLWFGIIILTLVLIYIATGKLGFMGDVGVAKGYVNVAPTSAILLDLILPVGAVLLLAGMKENDPKIKLIFTVLALSLVIVQFGFGRRVFVFSVLIYTMVFFFTAKSFRLVSLKNIIVFVLIGISIQVVTTSFSVLRISTYENKNQERTIFEMLPDAIKVYRDKDFYHVDEQIHNNLRSRTFVLEYLASIDKSLETIEPTYGNNLLRALVVSIPSVLYPSKFINGLFMTEEQYINPHFRLPMKDSSNSTLTGSLSDFGELGMFFIPFLFAFIYARVLSVSRKHISRISSIFLGLLFAYKLLSIEGDITVFFGTLRFSLIFMLILWFVFNFNKKTLPFKSALN